jgi:hypothetical protein
MQWLRGGKMKSAIVLFMLSLLLDSVCLAKGVKTEMRVSATIVPYCVVVIENGEMRQVCKGYENKPNVVPVVIRKSGNTTTLYY